ncbi:hypothetical protein DICVIV_12683 [Dictyocaulus viviparus]|uniref:RRM domain-containing protein n=1 Tax=Dictyocaulus viviparus TaxID=29172 RepID=A0A0D8XC52_DICVI|nr:hypothetical protein DICVIV_12683 [Dictyocaulus viviparus]
MDDFSIMLSLQNNAIARAEAIACSSKRSADPPNPLSDLTPCFLAFDERLFCGDGNDFGIVKSYTGAEHNGNIYSVASNLFPIHSRKVLLSGLPCCATPEDFHNFFSSFGSVEIVWPRKENNDESEHGDHAFAIFFSAESVIELTAKCTFLNGRFFIDVPIRGNHPATINVRVWLRKDRRFYCANFSRSSNMFTKNTVFVGGLPSTVTAGELYTFMSLKYGDVVMTQIEVESDTGYPRGAGCVVFRDREAFVAAIACGQAVMKVEDNNKQIALKPYLVRIAQCDICQTMQTRDFCPQLRCLKYMCETCWEQAHMDLPDHHPLFRASNRRRYSMNSIAINDNQQSAHQVLKQPKCNCEKNTGIAQKFEPRRNRNTDYDMFDCHELSCANPRIHTLSKSSTVHYMIPIFNNEHLADQSPSYFSNSYTRSDLVPSEKHVRARTSFSPTVRRPRRCEATRVQTSMNVTSELNDNSDTIVSSLSQFKLF